MTTKSNGPLGHNNSKHAFLLGLSTGIALLCISAIIVLGFVYTRGGLQKDNVTSEEVATEEPAPFEKIDTIDLDSLRYVRGEGELTFIEYSDLECPFCKTFHPVVNAAAEKYAGQIAFTFKHFPLNIHPKAKREAVAAECAGNQGKFFEYIDRIFDVTPSNNGLSDDTLFEIADELELDREVFDSCVDNEDTLGEVAADALEAQGTGGQGTPHSILVDENGQILTVFSGAVPESQLTDALDQYLSE